MTMVAKSGWPVMGHRLVNSGADELHEVVVVRVLVVEGFQHFRGVVGPVLGFLAAQVGDALQVFRGSHDLLVGRLVIDVRYCS